MHRICLLLATAALAACTTAPPQPRTAEAQAHLTKLLAGKVAGAPTTCLSSYRADDMVVIDDNTLVFRDTANRVYRNELRGPCNRLGSGFYALKTRQYGSGLCSGDIAEVIDTSTGMTVGSCAFGDFVPYTRPAA